MSSKTGKHDISELVEAKHHRAEIVFGVLSFGIALFLLSQIDGQTNWVKGQPFTKQPAFWSIVSIAGMTIFGVLELYFSWRRNALGRGDSIIGEVVQWVYPLEYVIWFMAYVWLVPLAGYLPVTLLFCLALAFRLGYRGKMELAAALLTGAATVVIFKSLLSVKIPGGAVYEYLPATLRNFMILYL